MENGTILRGEIVTKIGSDLYVVKDEEGKDWVVSVKFQKFPSEAVRLLGHHCEEVAGLKKGVAAELEINEGFLCDIRFDVPDVLPPTEPEVSTVTYIIGNGVICFAARPCGCQIYCHANMILATSFLNSFEEKQKIRHRTEVFRGKVAACAITIL